MGRDTRQGHGGNSGSVGTRQGRSFSALCGTECVRIVDGLGFYLVGTVVAACSSGARQRVGGIHVCANGSHRGKLRKRRPNRCDRAMDGEPYCSRAGSTSHLLVNRFVCLPYLSEVIIRVGRSESLAYFQVGSLAVHIQIVSTSSGHRDARAL